MNYNDILVSLVDRSDYYAFLGCEGQPFRLRQDRPLLEWNAARGGSVVMPTGELLSWESFRARPNHLDYTAFEEEGLGGALDVALFDWGTRHLGRTVTAMDLLTMMAPGQVRDNGATTQVLEVVGWWTVFFPLDWVAVLHYAPYELLWFMLQVVCAPEFQRPRRSFSPFRWSMVSLAMQPWEDLARQCREYGILGEQVYQWPVQATTAEGRYEQCRTVRRGIFAAATFPCVPLWRAYLTSGSLLSDCFSFGYLSNDDLRLLFRSIGGVDTVATPERVRTVRALAMDDLYFVDVGMWMEALGGMEAVILIPLVCAVLYGYAVPVTSSGMIGSGARDCNRQAANTSSIGAIEMDLWSCGQCL